MIKKRGFIFILLVFFLISFTSAVVVDNAEGVIFSEPRMDDSNSAVFNASPIYYSMNESGYSDLSPIDFMNKETDSFADGYIIEFEEKPLAVKEAELEKAAKDNTGKLFQNLPLLRNAYTTTYSLDSKISSYEEDFNSTREKVKDKIFNKRSLITGNAISDTNSEEIIMEDYRLIFNGIALNISEDEAEEIKKIDGVKSVSRNMKVEILLADSVPLIQDGILAGQLDGNGNDCTVSGEECLTGEGIKIAIIDTGIDYTHPDFGGCTSEQFLSGSCAKVIGGYDFINNDNNPMDDHGHGTHCAGIAAGNGILKGVAPDAKILAYKVLDAGGSGSFNGVIAGIERAVADGADVLSLSLGGGGDPDDPQSQAVDNAVLAGKVVVVAAGNSGPGGRTIRSPGTARNAIIVGASDKYNSLAYFSSRGPVIWGDNVMVKPDILAPGVNICAAQSSTNPWNDKLCLDDNHVAISGTSMATPHMAGVVALVKQKNSTWTPEEIKSSIKGTAISIGLSSTEQGAGRVNVRALVNLNEPMEYTEKFFFVLDSPGNSLTYYTELFKLDQKELVEFRGITGGHYSSMGIRYQKQGESEWKSDGIDIVLKGDLFATFNVSFLNNIKGMYTFNVSFFDDDKILSSKLVSISFHEVMKEPIEISNCAELQRMGQVSGLNYTALSYVLTQDIDCSETKTWGLWPDQRGVGFQPIIQDNETNIIYLFDGKGFNIKGLYTFVGSWGGLFNMIYKEIHINNVNLVDVNLNAWAAYIGGITPRMYSGGISNCSVSGKIYGDNFYIGGLVGDLLGGTISNSYSNVNVTASATNGWIVGGLVGNLEGVITNSYSISNVTGTFYIGGLVGQNLGKLSNSYSIGNVTKTDVRQGGVGGLVGKNYGIVNNSFWDINTSGQTISAGGQGQGKTTPEMKNISTFLNAGWDFENIWGIDSEINKGYPFFGKVCTSFTYSDWSICNSSGKQTREITSTYPEGCVGGNPNLTQDCIPNCTSFTYSYWSICNSSGKQTREIISSYPENCVDGVTPNLTQNCTFYPNSCWNPTISPHPICSLEDLNKMREYLSWDYILMNDIDASETRNWDEGKGWEPIGNPMYFNGNLDGKGYFIKNLYTNRGSNVGLFGYNKGNIYNLFLENVSIAGFGGLSGCLVAANNGNISNVHISGLVNSTFGPAGGIVGALYSGKIENSSFYGNVLSGSAVGGIVGTCSRCRNVYINNCFSGGSVSGNSEVGGLVGYSGPLKDYNISNSYSLSVVNGTEDNVGGLVGYSIARPIGVINSYFAGKINANAGDYIGGIIGQSEGSANHIIQNSYWDKEISGINSACGSENCDNSLGKTTSEMKNISTFLDAGWDFENIWGINSEINEGYPYLIKEGTCSEGYFANENGECVSIYESCDSCAIVNNNSICFNYNLFENYCQDDFTLVENYCGISLLRWDFWNFADKVARQKEVVCENGCVDGACMNVSQTCTDSDGGKNYYEKGLTKGIFYNTDSYTKNYDYCIQPDRNVLVENYCENGYLRDDLRVPCLNGCVDGACLEEVDELDLPVEPTRPERL